MEFYIRFADGDERWVTWSREDPISLLKRPCKLHAVRGFCRSRPQLFPLIYTAQEAQRRIAALNATPITEIAPGREVFVDLRSFGNGAWYNEIGLPDSEKRTYVIACEYGRSSAEK